MRKESLLVAGVCAGLAMASLAGWRVGRRHDSPGRRVAEGDALCASPPLSSLPDTANRPGMAELAGSLAHELNQPLTAITSNAQAAREYLSSGTPDPTEMREILDDIVSDASRASDIVRGVRALIRGEAPSPVPMQVREVIAQAIAAVQDRADARHTSLQAMADEGLPGVVADPVEIQLVLVNLLVNALDAVELSRPGGEGRVSVIACVRDDTVRVLVRDNGDGVAEGDLHRIFRPFYSSKPSGMGLGLSFSRALMERNGGALQATRNSHGGMTFECLLPVGAATPRRTTPGIDTPAQAVSIRR